MVRGSYGGIIGDAPTGAIPLGRMATVRGSLRRHAYAAMLEGYDDSESEERETGGKGYVGAGASAGRTSQVNLNAAGVDVGASSHFVAVSADRAEPPVREFAAFMADLYRLADWLEECGVETVVMGSTGVYWIPLFGVLEERGFQLDFTHFKRRKRERLQLNGTG